MKPRMKIIALGPLASLRGLPQAPAAILDTDFVGAADSWPRAKTSLMMA